MVFTGLVSTLVEVETNGSRGQPSLIFIGLPSKAIDEAKERITASFCNQIRAKQTSIERLNEEIRRRERVIRIFPGEESAIRLIGALLVEQDEKWSTGRKYLELDDYYNFLKEQNLTKDIAAA